MLREWKKLSWGTDQPQGTDKSIKTFSPVHAGDVRMSCLTEPEQDADEFQVMHDAC